MDKQSYMAAHSNDAGIRDYFTAMMTNRYLRPVLAWLWCPLPGPTTIREDNHPAIDIMMAGHISSRVKHMAVPIVMIYEDIQQQSSQPKNIPGVLNPGNLGVKPLPLAASSLHYNAHQVCGHQHLPFPTSEHGKSLQVEMVNQWLTAFDSVLPSKFNYGKSGGWTAVRDGKEQSDLSMTARSNLS